MLQRSKENKPRVDPHPVLIIRSCCYRMRIQTLNAHVKCIPTLPDLISHIVLDLGTLVFQSQTSDMVTIPVVIREDRLQSRPSIIINKASSFIVGLSIIWLPPIEAWGIVYSLDFCLNLVWESRDSRLNEALIAPDLYCCTSVHSKSLSIWQNEPRFKVKTRLHNLYFIVFASDFNLRSPNSRLPVCTNVHLGTTRLRSFTGGVRLFWDLQNPMQNHYSLVKI